MYVFFFKYFLTNSIFKKLICETYVKLKIRLFIK